ncbi:MAG: esterase-like activity of phytase family protein [Devosiaceae bacterium]
MPSNQFGVLTYLGGIALTSRHRNFEALSGLDILQTETRQTLLMVTDEGHWVVADLATTPGGAPTALANARIGPLLDNAGAPMLSKRTADAEGLALHNGPNGLEALVIAERNQPVRAYDLSSGAPSGAARHIYGEDTPLPHGRADGLEAIVEMTEGPLVGQTLVFLEDEVRPPSRPNAARILPDGTVVPFEIRRLDDFSITGAAMLPGGDVVIVERFFTWDEGVAMRIRHLPASDILAGAVEGSLLLEADGGTIIDNMEGIAVSDHANGPILTIISDNNGNFFQRTVLLRFQIVGDLATAQRLTPPAPAARPTQ